MFDPYKVYQAPPPKSKNKVELSNKEKVNLLKQEIDQASSPILRKKAFDKLYALR